MNAAASRSSSRSRRASAWTRSGRRFRSGTPVRAVSLAEAGRARQSSSRRAPTSSSSAASQAHDQALELIAAATAPAGGPAGRRPLQRHPERVPRAGVRGGRGRPDHAAAVAGQLALRAREGARAAARRRRRRATEGAMITVLGPEGRHRQDADVVQPRGRARARGQRRRCSSTSTCSSATSGSRSASSRSETIYDLAVSGGSLDGDKIDSFLAEHPSGARALLAPLRPGSGGGDRDRLPARGVRDPALTLRLRHRRHARRRSRPR